MRPEQKFGFIEAFVMRMNQLPEDDVAPDIKRLLNQFWDSHPKIEQKTFSEIRRLAEEFMARELEVSP